MESNIEKRSILMSRNDKGTHIQINCTARDALEMLAQLFCALVGNKVEPMDVSYAVLKGIEEGRKRVNVNPDTNQKLS